MITKKQIEAAQEVFEHWIRDWLKEDEDSITTEHLVLYMLEAAAQVKS